MACLLGFTVTVTHYPAKLIKRLFVQLPLVHCKTSADIASVSSCHNLLKIYVAYNSVTILLSVLNSEN